MNDSKFLPTKKLRFFSVYSLAVSSLLIIILGSVPIIIQANVTSINYDRILSNVDGTQLIQETKEYVAHHYNISVFLVSATYVGQTTNGKYKYTFSVTGGSSGWVEWQIIGGDDLEGALFED